MVWVRRGTLRVDGAAGRKLLLKAAVPEARISMVYSRRFIANAAAEGIEKRSNKQAGRF